MISKLIILYPYPGWYRPLDVGREYDWIGVVEIRELYLSLEGFYLNPDLWPHLSQPDLYEFQDDEGLEDEGSRRDCEDLI